jgi:glycosyltransferase involved in cell wall biosynthesis
MNDDALPADLGCVAIGRNEGERLRACLLSLLRSARPDAIAYVDSGSTDGSVELARALGVDVVALDLSIPFTAARARNVGYQHLLRKHPGLALVQFADGDCEIQPGWIERARARLHERPRLAVACGRRRERHPETSLYNRLCDVEWDTPKGDTRSCGGDAMIRLAALEEVDGYDASIIAGEEPELCVRLRARGWIVERLDAEMTLHDAAMTRMSQWWRRQVRAGHAYAEGVAMHGAPPERHDVAQYRRAWLWAAGVPLLALGGAIPTLGASLALLGGYPLSAARVYRHTRGRGRSRKDALVAGTFMTLGKFPELQGILKYHWTRARGRRSGLIEYKRPG